MNNYHKMKPESALSRSAGRYTAYAVRLDGSWGWLILDDFGVLRDAAREFLLTADEACAAADESLERFARHS